MFLVGDYNTDSQISLVSDDSYVISTDEVVLEEVEQETNELVSSLKIVERKKGKPNASEEMNLHNKMIQDATTEIAIKFKALISEFKIKHQIPHVTIILK